jgi:hypothetical protein
VPGLSAKLFALTLDTALPHVQKMVMLALANQANDYGEDCFPSFELIQRHSSLSRRTVFQALAALEEGGFISRRPLGLQRVEFVIHVDRLQQEELPMPATRTRNVPRPTGAPAAPVRQTHQCASRTGVGAAPVRGSVKTSAPAALHKAPKSTLEEEEGARAAELAELPEFDRRMIEPYLAYFPAAVTVARAVAFVKHRATIRKVLSISAAQELRTHLDGLAAQGVDINESLRLTMLAGYAIPVVPESIGKGRARAGPVRPRANDDFTDANYQGTDDADLPAHLRNAS